MVKSQKREKKALKKGQAKFMLVGEAKISDFTFKMNNESSRSDWVYHQLNLGVDCGNGNVVYAEMMGGYGAERQNVLYVHGKKLNDAGKEIDDYNNKFTIAWEDRDDEDLLENVGNSCFITVGLEKDTKDKVFSKKFLSSYDAIQYIKEHLEAGSVINVKGTLKYSIYNDEVQTKKEINSIYLSKKEPSDYKAIFTQTILLDQDSIGKLDKEKAVYPIYARVIDYTKLYGDKEVKSNVPFTKLFEMEVNKENPEHTEKLIDKVFRVKSNITEVVVEGDIVEGQTLVAITKDDFPDDIQELIDCGAYTLEDTISKMAVTGIREKRFIIRRPVIQLVGKDEKKPVIMKTENAYVESDLVFDFMQYEESKVSVTDASDDSEDDGNDNDDAWLSLLQED